MKGSSKSSAPPLAPELSSSRDRKVGSKLSNDSSVLSELNRSLSNVSSTIKKTKSQRSKQSQISLGESNDDTDDDPVVEFYQDVVVRQETSLGTWLRKNDFSSQGNAIDDFTTEIVGSVADIWLSTKQVALAFAVEDEAIDALTGTINDAAVDLSSGKYAN